MRKVKSSIQRFWKDEEGLGTLEIILIAAVLVGVALLFKDKLTQWVTSLLDNLGNEIGA